MPQKKNLDVMEYMRAKTHTVIAYQQMVAGISANLPSGYNADFGQTKKPFMESVQIVNQTMSVIQTMIAQLKPNIEILSNACTKELFAAHAAYEQVKKGVSFRAAYQSIGENLNKIPSYDVTSVIKQTNHTGGPGNLGLEQKKKVAQDLQSWWVKKDIDFKNVINSLLETKK
jgi:argininosuccinate lyase